MKNSFYTMLAFLIGVLICLSIVGFLGESPMLFLRVMYEASFASYEEFSELLYIVIPLTLTGLSVSVAYKAGLFNIGAEGQLVVGAIAATAIGILIPAPAPFSILLAVSGSFLAGALWAFLPGYFRAYGGSHEVIHGIMMNFVAMALTGFITLYLLKDSGSPHPDTYAIRTSYEMSPFSWAGISIPKSAWIVSGALFSYVLISKFLTVGYLFKMTGLNIQAAAVYGLPVKKAQVFAMMLSGGIAGLVGSHEILCVTHRFRIGFSPEYGYVGIAIAMLSGGSTLGLLAAAGLFGVLQKGALALDLETDRITRDFGMVIQGILILATASGPALKRGVNSLKDWIELRSMRIKI